MGEFAQISAIFAILAATIFFGIIFWTITEYVAHRFAMHSVGGRGPAAREHLMHHAEPQRTRAFIRTLGHLGMYTGAVVIGVVLDFLTGQRLLAVGIALGWALGYTLYESLHWLAHHRPPLTRFGARVTEFDLRLRRRHFHHHFAEPKKNLGVMFAGWDVLLATNVEPERIKVPRRLAMPWLVDEAGAVLPRYADDYVVCGGATRSEIQDAADKVRAFADQPPSLD